MEPEPNRIEAQASKWVVRRDAGLAPDQQREFDSWIAADARHHGAYVRAQAAWYDTDRVTALAHPSAMAQERESSDRRPITARFLAIAASIGALAIIATATWLTASPSGETYASEIGEVRRIELSDGSGLILNTNTRATVRYKDTQRDITLDRGEALFNVAHDTSRPFVVRANNILVRAVGTAFTVRVDDTRTDVVVTEGTVDVMREGASGTQTIQRVTANHRVMLASGESRPDIETVAPEVMERELAWRDGMVAFAGEPLSVAVAEINRHSRHRIHIDDPTLAARPVIGIFHANDAEAFASAAAVTFGARVEHANGDIHLRVGANPD